MTTERLEIGLRTLTPLWTGSVHRNSDHVRETGILGSMRWWYEGIVRGLGGHACDPTAEGKQRCEYKDSVAELCPACRLFGCTGWRRRFRLEVDGLQSLSLFFVASNNVYQATGNWLWRMFGGEETGGTKTGQKDKLKFTFGVKSLWGGRMLCCASCP